MNRYDDIIDLPHHVSPKRASMPMIDRAAQFSPFAALTGFEAVMEETARLTDHYSESDDSHKALINEQLQILARHQAQQPIITVTYFQADERKAGGAYITVTGSVKKIDAHAQCVRLTDETLIPFCLISRMESDLFPKDE